MSHLCMTRHTFADATLAKSINNTLVSDTIGGDMISYVVFCMAMHMAKPISWTMMAVSAV